MVVFTCKSSSTFVAQQAKSAHTHDVESLCSVIRLSFPLWVSRRRKLVAEMKDSWESAMIDQARSKNELVPLPDDCPD